MKSGWLWLVILLGLVACSSVPPSTYGPVAEVGLEDRHYPHIETTGSDGRSLVIVAFSGGGKRCGLRAGRPQSDAGDPTGRR